MDGRAPSVLPLVPQRATHHDHLTAHEELDAPAHADLTEFLLIRDQTTEQFGPHELAPRAEHAGGMREQLRALPTASLQPTQAEGKELIGEDACGLKAKAAEVHAKERGLVLKPHEQLVVHMPDDSIEVIEAALTEQCHRAPKIEFLVCQGVP